MGEFLHQLVANIGFIPHDVFRAHGSLMDELVEIVYRPLRIPACMVNQNGTQLSS
jgi:hypothetical protein